VTLNPRQQFSLRKLLAVTTGAAILLGLFLGALQLDDDIRMSIGILVGGSALIAIWASIFWAASR
jgi:hypothetical protein